MIWQNKMHFLIQHNKISKTQLCRFLPLKKSFYLQASVIGSGLFAEEMFTSRWGGALVIKCMV